MADKKQDKEWQGSQRQESAQSGDQPGAGDSAGKRKDEAPTGIGASQGQDRGSREKQGSDRPSAGTADVERDTTSQPGDASGGSQESLVNDSTGAFKERP